MALSMAVIMKLYMMQAIARTTTAIAQIVSRCIGCKVEVAPSNRTLCDVWEGTCCGAGRVAIVGANVIYWRGSCSSRSVTLTKVCGLVICPILSL